MAGVSAALSLEGHWTRPLVGPGASCLDPWLDLSHFSGAFPDAHFFTLGLTGKSLITICPAPWFGTTAAVLPLTSRSTPDAHRKFCVFNQPP